MDRYREREIEGERGRASGRPNIAENQMKESEKKAGRKKETHTHYLGKRGVKGFGPRFEWATDIPSTHTQHPSM